MNVSPVNVSVITLPPATTSASVIPPTAVPVTAAVGTAFTPNTLALPAATASPEVTPPALMFTAAAHHSTALANVQACDGFTFADRDPPALVTCPLLLTNNDVCVGADMTCGPLTIPMDISPEALVTVPVDPVVLLPVAETNPGNAAARDAWVTPSKAVAFENISPSNPAVTLIRTTLLPVTGFNNPNMSTRPTPPAAALRVPSDVIA